MEQRHYTARTVNERRDLCEEYERWVSEIGGPKAQFCRERDIEQSWFNRVLRHFGFSHLIGRKCGGRTVKPLPAVVPAQPKRQSRNVIDHDCDGNDERYKPTKADVVQLTPPTAHDGYALTLHVGDSHLHFEELPPASWLVELMRGID